MNRILYSTQHSVLLVGLSFLPKNKIRSEDLPKRQEIPTIKVGISLCWRDFQQSWRRASYALILTVMNITGITGRAGIMVQNPLQDGNKLMLYLELKAHEARCLLINTDCKGKRILYTTSEIIPQDKEYSSLELHGASGTKGEIAFSKPTKARLNGAYRVL